MSGKKKKKRKDQISSEALEQDENFYFIAGYTAGGFPYGITWGEYEMDKNGKSHGMNDKGEPMKELQLTKQQFKELVDAYDIYGDDFEVFLNIETGDVVTLRAFDLDEEDEELSEIIEEGLNEIYFQIPQRESREGYADMVDFAEMVMDTRLRTTLINILNGGKKVFRRFKDALASDSNEIERYYRFVEERNRIRVVDWLESIDVNVTLE
ncbi:UPF0158 family protein [Paenibacillus doosanensis]|uniref:UPF0158 family protein n=1 Tax=Paenibacillus doosanensis TaxID=1229154 RepID=UPI00217FDB66|nr:UPF0158 family protein [Paenibacillus doosanensis]MCS7461201.1 UPF0158 family protein [Paenibacillus doosanensis]